MAVKLPRQKIGASERDDIYPPDLAGAASSLRASQAALDGHFDTTPQQRGNNPARRHVVLVAAASRLTICGSAHARGFVGGYTARAVSLSSKSNAMQEFEISLHGREGVVVNDARY